MPPSVPLVSVVVPVHNGAAFVGDAVASILTDPGPTEIVVVDDGSTDGTTKILAGFGRRVVVVRQPQRGLPAARNAGIRRCQGDLVTFLDADDLHSSGYLERFRDAATRAPGAEVFHGGWKGYDFAGHVLYANECPLPLDNDPFHQMVAGSPPINALCVRRTVFERVGMFDESLQLQEDWDFWLRLASSDAEFKSVPGNTAVVRRHAQSMSARAGARLAVAGAAVLQRHLTRHSYTCPMRDACPGLQELKTWRRAILLASARDIARRLKVTGRAGRSLSIAAAAFRRPTLVPVAFDEAMRRFRKRQD